MPIHTNCHVQLVFHVYAYIVCYAYQSYMFTNAMPIKVTCLPTDGGNYSGLSKSRDDHFVEVFVAFLYMKKLKATSTNDVN